MPAVAAAAYLLVQVAVAAMVAVRPKVAEVGERARGGRPGVAAEEEAEAWQRRLRLLSSVLRLVCCCVEWSLLPRDLCGGAWLRQWKGEGVEERMRHGRCAAVRCSAEPSSAVAAAAEAGDGPSHSGSSDDEDTAALRIALHCTALLPSTRCTATPAATAGWRTETAAHNHAAAAEKRAHGVSIDRRWQNDGRS